MTVLRTVTILCAALLALNVSAARTADAAICTAKAGKAATSITSCMAGAIAGDVIDIEPGVYTDSANGGYETFPIVVKAGVSLIGHGDSNTHIYAPNASSALTGDSSGVMIDNLAITAINVVTFNVASGNEGVTIRNSAITSSQSGNGLTIVDNSELITIDNCRITAGLGIYIGMNAGGTSVKDVRINDTTLINVTGTAAEDAILLARVDKIVLTHVITKGWNAGPTISLWPTDIRIDSCDFEGVSTFGGGAKIFIRNSAFNPGADYQDVSIRTFGGGTQVRAVDTLISNGVSVNPADSVKLLNCYDSNLDPVVYP